MVQKDYSELTKKVRSWLSLRSVGLAIIGGLFLKQFYGLPLFFLKNTMSGLALVYLCGIALWLLVTRQLIQSESLLVGLSDGLLVLDILVIFFIGGQIFPVAEKFQFIPITEMLNVTAFLYFLDIIASGVVLGLGHSLFICSLVSILFIFERYYFVSPTWFVGQHSLAGVEPVLFFYLGLFLVGFLARQAENKKNELTEVNFELTQKIKDLEGHRKELIQLEKKASLHQLAVSLNHEINNPLTSVLGNAQFFYERFEKNPDSLPANFSESVYDCLIESKKIKELLRKIRKISEPIISEYIPGIKMIDIDRAVRKK